MLRFSPFYNSTIRKTVGAFGALFNDIEIIRVSPDGTKQQRVKVPLSYASADKAFARKSTDPTLNYNMMQTFPRMAFYMTALTFDPSRRLTAKQMVSTNGQFLFAPAPYNLDFDLYLATANFEDGLQIVEQILPFFAPEFTITTKAIPSLEMEYDVPVVLNSVSYTDPAIDSDFTEARIVEWTLTFTAKTYMFGPTRTREQIKHANLQLFTDLPFDNKLVGINADVTPDTANKSDVHIITTTITE